MVLDFEAERVRPVCSQKELIENQETLRKVHFGRVCPVLCVNDQGLFLVLGCGDGVAGEGDIFPFPCSIHVEAVTVFTPRSFPGTASAPATRW
jgi:hypothetical protein